MLVEKGEEKMNQKFCLLVQKVIAVLTVAFVDHVTSLETDGHLTGLEIGVSDLTCVEIVAHIGF